MLLSLSVGVASESGLWLCKRLWYRASRDTAISEVGHFAWKPCEPGLVSLRFHVYYKKKIYIYIVTRGWFKTVHFEEGENKKERDDRKKNNKISRIFS